MNEKNHKPASNASVKQAKKNVKHWVAVVLFAAIIIVFVLMGVSPDQLGGGTGGVAATVNNTAITLNEYRSRVESIEQNARMRFDQFPEAQRKALSQELRRRALEELIMGEVVYQAANSRGVLAPDAEVRDYILQIPFLQENGRFLKDRYHMFLRNMNLTSDDFERQVRKQLVGQKLQELFIGSATPTREELKRTRALSSQKVNIRYAEIKRDDLAKPAFMTDADVAAFLAANKAEVENYYKSNTIEFTKPEKVRASHILIRIDDKRKDPEAAKMAAELRKQATAKNFSQLASKNSDDPGSKAKGGELGEFERGRMVPEFEKAAFELKAGEISQPVKTPFGYHIIYVDKKIEGGTTSLENAQNEIARKLLLRNKETEIVAKTRTMLEKSDKKEVDSFLNKAGLKWNESGEFDLAAPSVPKLGESKEVVEAILKRGKSTGLVPHLIGMPGGRFVIVDVTSWKDVPEKSVAGADGMNRMVAYRKSSDLIEAWSREVEAKASVQRNPMILQQ